MIRITTYHAETSGPRLLVLGAVHGNEKSGTVACQRIMAEIDAGDITLLKGRLTLVPISNPKAYELDHRWFERNLNRYMVPMAQPDCYEARLGNILCPRLADCDYHLSLHSYTAGGPPFSVIEQGDEKGRDWAAALGPTTMLTGWVQAYAATGRKQTKADDEESTGTTEYARRFGATAVTLETGQHQATDGPAIAYCAIRNTLAYLGMIGGVPDAEAKDAALFTITHVFYRDREGSLAKPWAHLEKVAAGEVIARYADGVEVVSPYSGVIIMPKANPATGEEWFYIATKK